MHVGGDRPVIYIHDSASLRGENESAVQSVTALSWSQEASVECSHAVVVGVGVGPVVDILMLIMFRAFSTTSLMAFRDWHLTMFRPILASHIPRLIKDSLYSHFGLGLVRNTTARPSERAYQGIFGGGLSFA